MESVKLVTFTKRYPRMVKNVRLHSAMKAKYYNKVANAKNVRIFKELKVSLDVVLIDVMKKRYCSLMVLVLHVRMSMTNLQKMVRHVNIDVNKLNSMMQTLKNVLIVQSTKEYLKMVFVALKNVLIVRC